jgi:hypothetical protein
VASRLLTLALALSGLAFVALTVGSSLVGSTSFYGGGNLLNSKPWSSTGEDRITVTNNSIGDTIDYFIPGRSQMVDRVHAGDLPGWNSLQGAGAALGAIPSYGLLPPTGWSWWILPHSLAPGWEKLTVLLLATAGTALFLRRLGVGGHAAWLGGMIYAGSGFMIAWTNWPQAGVAAMLPWLLWSAERALQLRSWRAQIPVALTVAFLLLGGFPAVAGLGLYAAGGYVLVRVCLRDGHAGRRARAALADVGRLSVALVTGFLLAGIQLAAFLYTLLDLDTDYRADAFSRMVPLRMALTAVFPNAWGTRAGGPFFIGTNPIEANAYFGAAAAVLVGVALLLRPGRGVLRGARAYFVGVALVGGLLIYVQGGPLELFGALPVFSGNPIGRLVSVVLLAAAVLAGIGFDAVLRRPVGTSWWSLARLTTGLAVMVTTVVVLGRWIDAQTTDRLAHGPQEDLLRLAVTAAAVTAGAVLLAYLRLPWRGALLALVPVAVVVQGISAATPMWAQVDRSAFYPTTPVHEYLLEHQGHDRIAVTGATMVNGSTAYYGLRSATGHVFSPPRFNQLLHVACLACRLSPTYWVLPGSTDLRQWRSPLLDRMGVRYLTADPGIEVPGRSEDIVVGDQDVVLPTAGEQPLTVGVPAGPLRGFRLAYRSGPAELSPGHLVATVRNEDGEVLASTRRMIEATDPAVPLFVPVAGEELPADGMHTVEFSWDGPSEPPVLAGDANGLPSLTVIRPVDDGLRVAYAQEAVVWERLSALPRIRWAGETEVIQGDRLRILTVARLGVPPDTVVLEREGERVDGAPAEVEVLEDSGDVVRARVDAEGAGHLVLADNVQTDWTVTVDGEPAPIVPADHAFGAVHLPAGVSEVTFSYAPRGATAGLVASGVGVVVLLLMAAPPAWWRRLRRNRAVMADEQPPTTAEETPRPAPVG